MATVVKRPKGKAEIRAAVIEAASALFAERGVAAVSMREIAERAQVSYSLVHRHFGTKDELLRSLLDRDERRWEEVLASGDTDAVLRDLLDPPSGRNDYLQMLAWTILADPNRIERVHLGPKSLPVLVEPLPGSTEVEQRLDTAALISLAFGWRFFGPMIREVVGIADLDPTEAREAMFVRLTRIAGRTEERVPEKEA